MPKKTRRQKALSQKRRIEFLLKQKDLQPSQEMRDEIVETVKTDYVTYDFSYFVSDLKRSLLFIAIVITLEIVVYFGTINRYLGR